MTLDEIAQATGLTRQRVHQILNAAMKKLRKRCAPAHIEALLRAAEESRRIEERWPPE